MRSGQAGRILVVEDDRSIVMGLRLNLEAEGYRVDVATDGADGLECLRKEEYQLVILDLMLPRLNGFEVLEALRSWGTHPPIVVLSARTGEGDKVGALEMGAEDYVTKPFSLAEFLARIRVVLRRNRPADRWTFGDIEVDTASRRVLRRGEEVELTRTEFDVLAALARAGGEVRSREDIFEAVWGPGHHGTKRTIDNFMAQLRAKLEDDPAEPRHLVTVRGVGYRLAV